jgi:hypothetical protein
MERIAALIAARWYGVPGLIVAASVSCTGCASARTSGPVLPSPDVLWQPAAERPRGPDVRGQSAVVRLNKRAFDALMATARGSNASGAASGVVIALPMPDGTFARFRVFESSVLAPELSEAFPEIRTYSGQGIDDPTATTRLGWTHAGFHAIVIGASGTVYIDPYKPGDVEYYVSFRKPS